MKTQRWLERYDRWFSVTEIYQSQVLKAALGAVLFIYFVTFLFWAGETRFTVEAVQNSTHICWPYFTNCGAWYWFSGLPYGYSQQFWYMVLFALIAGSAWAMIIGHWRWAHALMWPLFLWKLLWVLVLSMAQVGNYEYYHLVFSAVLLLCPHKEFFLKFSVVWFYFLSTAAKIHPSWTLGTYFSSLKTGLPLFPDNTIPIWTNLVVIMEMVAAWWLLSPRGWLQRAVLIFFVIFHLYSGLLVSYRYPATVLPMLFILFGPWYQTTKIPSGLSTVPGWILIGLLGLAQSISHFIPGDEKLTMEGNFYGLYMFEANHQCRSDITVHYHNREAETFEKEVFKARDRCDSYRIWFRYNQLCQSKADIKAVSVKFDHSINGAPFYRIIDEPNICALKYHPFKRNDWIKTPDTGAQKVGYPMYNYYY